MPDLGLRHTPTQSLGPGDDPVLLREHFGDLLGVLHGPERPSFELATPGSVHILGGTGLNRPPGWGSAATCPQVGGWMTPGSGGSTVPASVPDLRVRPLKINVSTHVISLYSTRCSATLIFRQDPGWRSRAGRGGLFRLGLAWLGWRGRLGRGRLRSAIGLAAVGCAGASLVDSLRPTAG